MSYLMYIASDYPLEERPNPHDRLVSVNEALALGLPEDDIPKNYLAPDFDRDAPEMIMISDRDVEFIINTEDPSKSEIRDGGFDDDFSLLSKQFALESIHTEKRYFVSLDWRYYTEGRAYEVIDYIRKNLEHTDEIEIWHIWMGYYEKPIVRTKYIHIDELLPSDIKALEDTDPGKLNPELYGIPEQYRIVVKA